MKIPTGFRRAQFLIIPLLAAMFLFSCSDSESPPLTEDPSYDRTTPDNLLVMLMGSYKEQDLDGYAECLDKDFLFQFTEDVAHEIGLPQMEPWWGKTTDLASTGMMFEDPHVESITCTYEVVGSWMPHTVLRSDTTFSGLFHRIDPLIEVAVAVSGCPGDPWVTYRVDGSWLDIVVVQDRFAEGHWCILSIQELEKSPGTQLGSAGTATEPSTWGNIKSLWY
jgi:hypothetical protein